MRRWHWWTGSVLILLSWRSVTGQVAPPRLVPDVPVTVDVAFDSPARFEITAAAGDILRVRVDQIGLDVRTAVVDGAGVQLANSDVLDRPSGAEFVVVEAQGSDPLVLSVSSADTRERRGQVRVRLDRPRPATDRDRASIAAERELHATLDAAWPHTPPTPADRRSRIAALDRVQASFATAGDTWGRARTLVPLALIAINGELWDRVEPALPDAIALWRQLDDPPSLAYALNLQALSLEATGHMAAAEPFATEAYALSKAHGDLPMASLVANNLGIIHDSLGDAETAYDRFTEALALRTQSGRGVSETTALLNLARVAANLGALEDAKALHERARPLLTRPETTSTARIAANNYGNLLRRMGDLDGALRLHHEALALGERLQSPAGEAQALNGIGTDLFELGRPAEAEEYQGRSVAIRRSLNDPAGLAAVLQNLGHTVSTLGRFDEGLALLHESREIRERIADVRSLPGVWHAISQAEQGRRRLDDALAAAERSLVLVESLRDALTAPSLRASFVAREHANYEHYVNLLMTAFEERGDTTYEQRAFEAADRARARGLLDALLSARVDVRAGVPREMLDEERRLEQAAEEASTRLSRLLVRQAAEADVAAARDVLARRSAELERQQARVLRESPAYASLLHPEPTPLDVVQRDLLDADTVLLQYSIGEARSWVWAVSRDGVRSVPLAGRSAIASAVRDLREAVEARAPRPGETARAAAARIAAADAALPAALQTVSALALGALAPELSGPWQGRRLAVVAGDALDYVPFAALPLPGSRQMLTAGHEVVMLPSVSALRATRGRAARPRPRVPHVEILADPVFEASDPRVIAAGQARPAVAPPSAGATPPLARALRATRGTAAPALARLAFSGLEASAIAQLLPSSHVHVVTGFDANRDAVTSGALASADVVHLATHGLISPSQPSVSGLVVSLLDRRGRTRDGFLRLGDIYNLRLDADLVVLSACQTALGAEVRGEGLVGLTRGFLFAGARRVVASLWAVDDSATAALMARFYRGMLRDGLTPPAALRAAQRHIAAQPQWAAPYFWAGFVLQGDWR